MNEGSGSEPMGPCMDIFRSDIEAVCGRVRIVTEEALELVFLRTDFIFALLPRSWCTKVSQDVTSADAGARLLLRLS